MSTASTSLRDLIPGVVLAIGVVASQPSASAADPASTTARVGRVYTGSPSTVPRGFSTFSERLRELGWAEGRNLVIEDRWAEGRDERFPALIRDLVERRVDVIVVTGTAAAVAAKQVTSSIPIVVAGMGDPVGAGVAESIARPGGNLTGLSVQNTEGMPGKWLELLKEAVPRLATVAVIVNPSNPLAGVYEKRFQAAARVQNLKLRFLSVSRENALDDTFARASKQAQAAVVVPEVFTMYHRKQITMLAAKHRLPVMYGLLDFVDVGGLMAYGVDLTVVYEGAAIYVDKILRGAHPAALPIEQPTKFTLVVNLKTAKALGIPIPESILLRADEVIR
jgi:putative ABC transport system substrate-binding protein